MAYQLPVRYMLNRENHIKAKYHLKRSIPLKLFSVEIVVNYAAANITIHESSFSTYVSCTLYVHTRLPKTELIISNIALEVEFTDELGLYLIPYYFSIKYFLSSLPIFSDT